MDIKKWIRTEATIVELREIMEGCREALRKRAYFCAKCGKSIPTALPAKHPAHDEKCERYVSMVSY